MFPLKIPVIFLVLLNFIRANDINIVFWIDPVQKDIYADIAATLKEVEGLHLQGKIIDSVVVVENVYADDTNKNTMDSFCDILLYTGASIVLDFTYDPWEQGLDFVKAHYIPYMRVGRMLRPFLQMLTAFVEQKRGTEIVMLMQNEQDTREVVKEIMHGLPFRILIINTGDASEVDFVTHIKKLRPSPGYYAIFAKGSNMNAIFEKLHNGGVFSRSKEWHFIFLDARDRLFKYKQQVEYANKFSLSSKGICKSLQMKDAYCQSGFTLQRAMLLEIFRALIDIRQTNILWLEPIQVGCNITASDDNNSVILQREFDILDHFRLSDFMTFESAIPINKLDLNLNLTPLLTYRINVTIGFYSNEHDAATDIAIWQKGELKKINDTITPAKRYFRIGTAEAIPWSYYRKNPHTGEIILDSNGNPIWEGFCIDMMKTLSEKLNFEYEIVPPTKGKFGRRDPVTKEWDGLIGDLVSGETDFAIAALKMYSEREEYIDFIAPYFEQTGITIVMRKPVKRTSLFKFMTVLRVEVWLSIIAALVATAIMMWLLDKYSPYSARNNKEAYPYECREFTLRECFWFALTSFTPQGGGEAPKAVSSRILVAAYWLFVVLMLATFTANLAAFLTVERMQAPVQSLEQLARQSRINYTVVDESDTHHYFINMDFAEQTLYRMWKDLALNASRDFQKFRVWDYPIKEQYGRILLAINSSTPVKNAEEGFRKVNERENADFAFIHDASEIKYEITKNCNLTEVGEVFAQQPYAVAIQQGSHFADPLGYALLELQKDRYFEELKAKYWNRSRTNCPLSEEEQGITLESLGGVFIATLCGLGIAMISLAVEVLYNRKNIKNRLNDGDANITQVKPIESIESSQQEIWHSAKDKKFHITPPPSFETATFRGRRKIPAGITLGSEFKPGKVVKRRTQGEDLQSELPPYME